MGADGADAAREVRHRAARGDAGERDRHVDHGPQGRSRRSAHPGPRRRLREPHRVLHLHRPWRRPDRAGRAGDQRVSPGRERGLRHRDRELRCAGVRRRTRPGAHRSQHGREHRGGRRALLHWLPPSGGDARRTVGVPLRLRGKTGIRFQSAASRLGDHGVRRGGRDLAGTRGAGALQRSHHPGRHRTGRCRVVAHGPAARARAGVILRLPVHLHHGAGGRRGGVERPHHPGRGRHDDRLGRAPT